MTGDGVDSSEGVKERRRHTRRERRRGGRSGSDGS